VELDSNLINPNAVTNYNSGNSGSNKWIIDNRQSMLSSSPVGVDLVFQISQS